MAGPKPEPVQPPVVGARPPAAVNRSVHADDPLFAPVLQRLATEREKLFGSERARLEPVQRLSRRYSEVLRLRVDDGERKSYAFLKVNRVASGISSDPAQLRRNLLQDFAHQQQAYESMRGNNVLAVARPIACFPDEFAVITEEVSGQPLEDAIRAHNLDAWLGDDAALQLTFERVGAWLRTFQERRPMQGTVSVSALRSYVDVRLQHVVAHGGAFGAEQRRLVLRRFDALASEVRAEELAEVPIHGDLSLENVLVDGQRVTAIDFDVAAGATGTRLHDAAYLHLALERLKGKPWVRAAAIDRLQRAVLRGMDPRLSASAPLFQLHLLQHMVCHLVEALDAKHGVARRLYSGWLWRPCKRWLGI